MSGVAEPSRVGPDRYHVDVSTAAQIRASLTDILVAVVDCDAEEVVDDALLVDLGVDSIALVEVADELGRRNGTYLPDDVVNELRTVADAVAAVLEPQTRRGPVATTLGHPAPEPRDPHAAQRASAMSKLAGVFVVLGALVGVLLGLGGAALVAATGIGGVDLPPISAPAETTPAPTPTEDSSPSPEPTEEPEDEPEEPTFEVSSDQVAPGERFELTGRFPELAPGEVLQVQAREGDADWEDFPVTAVTGADGTYRTNVFTSRTGPRDFRMLHRASDTATEPQTVTIG